MNFRIIIVTSIVVLIMFSGCMMGSGGQFETWPLTKEQVQWESKTQQQYDCSVNITKGDRYNGIDYSEDATVHIKLDFSDKNKVMNMSNSEIESLGVIIAQSFYPLLERKEEFKFIRVDFRNHDSLTEISTYPENKSAIYNLSTQKVIPNIKEPFVSPTKFAYMWQNGVGEYNRGFLSLGFDIAKLNPDYFPNLRSTGKVTFKELTDCDSYESVNTDRIILKNGYITVRAHIVQYNNSSISVTYEYNCYPSNNSFHYKEVVKALCFGDYTKPEITYVNYLHPTDLDRKTINRNSIISAVADTSSIPWKITYTSSINELNFYYDTALQFR